MIKRLLMAMMLIMSVMAVKAQGGMTPMPLNPKVKTGVLSNGLTYYILHNEEPKNRANFYIAQKVGSSLETSQQLGLAHFLEHMAFNGTTHFPGNSMLSYLQTKGIKFGSDINAYTGFDETVYNINNVPCNDKALMDSVLLVLADWSGSILLNTDEIDAERGVIENEYTMRNDANTRFYTALLPQIYEEYQYRQMPIGTMEVVKNFPPEVLRDYYKKWYRPDLQGIIIVGDFDADEMESKVKALFSQIEMPKNPAERVYVNISDNEKPKYITFEDPELQMPRIDTYFKFDRTPMELRNTVEAYVFDNIISSMVASMINNRLNEYVQKPDCPYSYAGVSIGTFLVSRQKGSFNVVVIPKDNYLTAYQSAMGIIAQACKTGFMGTEVQRVRDELLASIERQYNERDKTSSEVLGRDLIDHFIDSEPSPGIEAEYENLRNLLPSLPEAVYNQYAGSLLHIDNSAIVISQPNTIGLNIPAENEMLTSLGNVINADYEPYVDEVITEPLVANLPTPGKVVSEKSNNELGAKEYILSNGVKVVVKPTDFSNDEVLIQMFKPGGKATYASSDAANVIGMDLLLEVSNIGPFNPVNLGKYLAGKKVSLNYNVHNYNNIFSGYSTAKDVESLFELLFASFTDVTPDQDTYTSTLSQLNSILANQESNPEYIFQLRRYKDMYPHTPSLYPLSLETVRNMDYERMMSLYKESVKNASDYTLVITGNVNEGTIKPLLEQYIATLPSLGVKNPASPELVEMSPVPGKINDEFDIKAQNPAVFIYDCFYQNGMPYSVKNDVLVDLTGEVLYMIFLETLREEMGGTYSPQAYATLNPYTSSWTLIWNLTTTDEQKDAIIKRANDEFKKLMAEGTDMQHFAKIKEQALKAFENEIRTNNFWLRALVMKERGFNPITGRHSILENLTLDELNNFIKSLYNGQNQIEIVGVAK